MSPEQLEARQANNDAIRGAADWRVLAALLEERGSNFDAENIVTMLHRVGPRALAYECTKLSPKVDGFLTWAYWGLFGAGCNGVRHVLVRYCRAAMCRMFTPRTERGGRAHGAPARLGCGRVVMGDFLACARKESPNAWLQGPSLQPVSLNALHYPNAVASLDIWKHRAWRMLW